MFALFPHYVRGSGRFRVGHFDVGRFGAQVFRCADVSVCERFGVRTFRHADVSACGRFGRVYVSVCGRFGVRRFRRTDILGRGHSGEQRYFHFQFEK